MILQDSHGVDILICFGVIVSDRGLDYHDRQMDELIIMKEKPNFDFIRNYSLCIGSQILSKLEGTGAYGSLLLAPAEGLGGPLGP